MWNPLSLHALSPGQEKPICYLFTWQLCVFLIKV